MDEKQYEGDKLSVELEVEPLPEGRILCIIRGCPGSGKSTLAKQLQKNGIICSSDEFYVKDGVYLFNYEQRPHAHEWNQRRVFEGMKNGVSPIIIDNTNVLLWQMKPYVHMALKFNYNVIIREPQTPWKLSPPELTRKNTHGVPENVIESMLKTFERFTSIEDVLHADECVREWRYLQVERRNDSSGWEAHYSS